MPTTLLRFYARFAKTLHNELEIGRVLVRQYLAAMFKGIVRVNTKDLLPLGAGFLGPAQMTETRCQQHARNVSVWMPCQPAFEHFHGLFIEAQLKISLRLEVQIDIGIRI
jgi:hypothetical protein